MEINGNNFSEPVRFYNKNTENIIKQEFEKEATTASANLFSFNAERKETAKLTTHPIKKRRKTKRLNVLDSEYLPDENIAVPTNTDNNIFVTGQNQKKENKIKKALNFLFTKVPLINYFFLRKKSDSIKETVEKLSDITQDVDSMLGTQVPYGEDSTYYDSIAKNLSNAAEIIGKSETKE